MFRYTYELWSKTSSYNNLIYKISVIADSQSEARKKAESLHGRVYNFESFILKSIDEIAPKSKDKDNG